MVARGTENCLRWWRLMPAAIGGSCMDDDKAAHSDAPDAVPYRPERVPATPDPEAPPTGGRLRRIVFGPAIDVKDPHTYHSLGLAVLFAWVGLGADGLSSSA